MTEVIPALELTALFIPHLHRPPPRRRPARPSRRARCLPASDAGEDFVLESTAKQVRAEYAGPVARERVVRSAEEAVEAWQSLARPVAAKVLSYDLLHKSDAGALRLGLDVEAAVKAAWSELAEAFPAEDGSAPLILVQTMAPASIEVSCGMSRDEVFGPIVTIWLDGALGGRLVGGTRGLDPAAVKALTALMAASPACRSSSRRSSRLTSIRCGYTAGRPWRSTPSSP